MQGREAGRRQVLAHPAPRPGRRPGGFDDLDEIAVQQVDQEPVHVEFRPMRGDVGDVLDGLRRPSTRWRTSRSSGETRAPASVCLARSPARLGTLKSMSASSSDATGTSSAAPRRLVFLKDHRRRLESVARASATRRSSERLPSGSSRPTTAGSARCRTPRDPSARTDTSRPRATGTGDRRSASPGCAAPPRDPYRR